mgnify:CR=1 FL=1
MNFFSGLFLATALVSLQIIYAEITFSQLSRTGEFTIFNFLSFHSFCFSYCTVFVGFERGLTYPWLQLVTAFKHLALLNAEELKKKVKKNS